MTFLENNSIIKLCEALFCKNRKMEGTGSECAAKEDVIGARLLAYPLGVLFFAFYSGRTGAEKNNILEE